MHRIDCSLHALHQVSKEGTTALRRKRARGRPFGELLAATALNRQRVWGGRCGGMPAV